MPKSKRLKIGEVLAIPLPDKSFAFGKIFNDAGIGIYQHIGNDISDLPNKEKFQFIVGVYNDVVKSEEWLKVDFRSFEDEDSEWPTPACVIDDISGEYSIYYKGEFHKATEGDCEGLEIAAVWEGHAIVERIMKDERWKKY